MMMTIATYWPTTLSLSLSTLDFSIYHDEITVLDPSGVQLTGLKNYKNSFGFLQTIVRFFYNTAESCVQSRMVYDFARQSIRISWNVVLVPKVVGNRRNALYVDGISIYKMDSKSGKIVEHKVEKLLVNNIPVTPPYGILTTLREELLYPGGQRIPVGVGVGVGAMCDMNNWWMSDWHRCMHACIVAARPAWLDERGDRMTYVFCCGDRNWLMRDVLLQILLFLIFAWKRRNNVSLVCTTLLPK